jgi:RecA-family ATPase
MNHAPPLSHFEALWALGYHNLCPIIPPAAKLWEHSIVYKRLADGDDARGKAPGLRRADGKWCGLDFPDYCADERDLKRWQSWGAGVGIICRDDVKAIDSDTMDPELARIIKQRVVAAIGSSPIRIGRYPKALYVVRVSAPFAYRMFEFGPKRKKRERIEILSGGKQFVAHGVHPLTLEPYYWPKPLLPHDELPVVDPDVLTQLMDELRDIMPDSGPFQGGGSGSAIVVDQETLRGKPELVRAAIEAIPNTDENFPSRESYLKIGYRLKAALPDDEPLAFSLYDKWCEGWKGPDGDENDSNIVAADWQRMKGPFRCGAPGLFWIAKQISAGTFDASAIEHHEDLIEEEAPEPTDPAALVDRWTVEGGLEVVTMSTLAGKPIPQQPWLVKGIIPGETVTMFGGEGSAGKSIVALQLAAAVATGGTWLGYPVEKGRVLYLAAEDELNENWRRVAAIHPALEELDDFILAPYAEKDAILAAPNEKGVLKPTPVFKRMSVTIEAISPALVILDTLADIFGGDEIKKLHARAFVTMLRGIAIKQKIPVLFLQHPSLTGISTGTGNSGNVAWRNSVRSQLYIEAPKDSKGVEINTDARQLSVKKANRAAAGLIIPLRYSAGKFIREGAAASPQEVGPEAERLFLMLLDQFEREGRHTSPKPKASNYAPKTFAAHADSQRMGERHLKDAMDRLLKRSVIRIAPYGRGHDKLVRVLQSEVANNDLFG